jgi:hypothetical protein
MATKDQAARKKCQTMHVYYDEDEDPVGEAEGTPFDNETKMMKKQWSDFFK